MTCPFAGGSEQDGSCPNDETLDYHSYLGLDKVLTANTRQSALKGQEAHTEHLFITIHQSFELWFKQMIHELRSVILIFQQETVEDKKLLFIHNNLQRVGNILLTLTHQFKTLESMSSMEFLEFRSYLGKSSGFQSWQFRVFENLLGLKPQWRNRYGKKDYKEFLRAQHRAIVAASEDEDDLLTLVCDWLARCPFVVGEFSSCSFWKEFRKGVRKMLNEEIQQIEGQTDLDEVEREEMLEETRQNHEGWRLVFDEDYFNELQRKNKIKWTYGAFQGAIFINHYRNHPSLQMPHKILVDLLDIETAMRQFRMRHADMVHRMLGNKIGTGGSSGYHYLRTSATKHQVFGDFFNMNSYILSNEYLPDRDVESFLATNDIELN